MCHQFVDTKAPRTQLSLRLGIKAGYAREDQPKCVFPFCTIPFFLTFKPRAFQWASDCFDLGRPTTFTQCSGRAAASSGLETKCILHIAIAGGKER